MARLAEVPAPAGPDVCTAAQMYDCAITLALAAIAAARPSRRTVGAAARRASPPAGGPARRSPTASSCSPPARTSTTTARPGASTSTSAGDISSARLTTCGGRSTAQLQPSRRRRRRPRRRAPAGRSSLGAVFVDPAAAGAQGCSATTRATSPASTTRPRPPRSRRLQRDLGLPETGEFDEATDAALRERLGVAARRVQPRASRSCSRRSPTSATTPDRSTAATRRPRSPPCGRSSATSACPRPA